MVFIVLAFITGSVGAQVGPVGNPHVRDNASYYIHFEWTDNRGMAPCGLGYEGLNDVAILGAKLMMGFNVYAKNGQPDYDTGAPVVDHSYYPDWFGLMGWDVPDFTYYVLTIDTHAKTWILCYIDYSTSAVAPRILNRLNVPFSGKTKHMTFIEEGVIEIELEEAGGDWKVWWGGDTNWDYEDVKLDDKKFIAHIDFNEQQGWIAPKDIVKPKKPKK